MLGAWSNKIMEPDYTNYSIEELNDALLNVDKDTYPLRAKKIEEEIEKRNKIQSAPEEQTKPIDEKKFGVGAQLFLTLLSVFFLYNGVSDLLAGETYARGGGHYNPTDNPIMFYGHILLYVGLSVVLFYIIHLGRRKNAQRT